MSTAALLTLGLLALSAGCSPSDGGTAGDPAGEESDPQPVVVAEDPLGLLTAGARDVPEEDAVRPVVRLHVYDQAESWFGNAELYLTVQSSRFAPNSLVVLPINVGQFAAVEDRFVELPFPVVAGDTLSFNLLDDDAMGEEGERLLSDACQLTGYAVVLGGAVYAANPVAAKAAPVAAAAGETVGRAVGLNWNRDHFDNYGTALYTVPEKMPTADGLANQINLVSGRRGYSVGGGTAPQTPAYVKIYVRE